MEFEYKMIVCEVFDDKNFFYCFDIFKGIKKYFLVV